MNKCVFHNSSTNPITRKFEMPKTCKQECDGHDRTCPKFVNHEVALERIHKAYGVKK